MSQSLMQLELARLRGERDEAREKARLLAANIDEATRLALEMKRGVDMQRTCLQGQIDCLALLVGMLLTELARRPR